MRGIHKPEPSLCACTCGQCYWNLTTSKNLLLHLRNPHKFKKTIFCNACWKMSGHESTLYNHSATERSSVSSETFVNEKLWASVPQVLKIVSAQLSSFKILRFNEKQEKNDSFALLMSNRSSADLSNEKKVTNEGIYCVGLCIQVVISKPLDGEIVFLYFSTRLQRLLDSMGDCNLYELIDQLFRQITIFCDEGSCWFLKKLPSLDIPSIFWSSRNLVLKNRLSRWGSFPGQISSLLAVKMNTIGVFVYIYVCVWVCVCVDRIQMFSLWECGVKISCQQQIQLASTSWPGLIFLS